MTLRFDGQIAIVTGAGGGLGRAHALALAARGAAVVVNDLGGARDGTGGSATAAEAVVAEIEAMGGQAMAAAGSVTDEAAVQAMVDAAMARWGRIDILVNNAGVAGANKPTHEIDEAEWDFVQSINVKGVFYCTKHTIPVMRRCGGGSIINLSSIYGLVGAPDSPPYHASKGAVRLMTKTDALLYAADKIRVNSVHPGFIWTPMVEGFVNATEDAEKAREAVTALHPLGHIGEPDDIAWACVYLASDEAKFVTGAEFVIDGGYTAR